MFCAQCGGRVDPGSSFCSNWGAKIRGTVKWKSLLTKKTAALAALVCFVGSIVSCDLVGGLDNEALRRGKKYFEERMFLQCGDSWIGRISMGTFLSPSYGFVQVKNLGYALRKVTLTEAHKANGIEWEGDVAITGKRFRIYSPHGAILGYPSGWSEWRNWPRSRFEPGGFTAPPVSVRCINGQWQVGNAPLPHKIDFSCSQIPG